MMPEVELPGTGEGDYRLHDPDVLRVWMRDRKRRELVDATTSVGAVDSAVHPRARELEILGDHLDAARTVIGRPATAS
jgi:hypothetical protein